MAESNVAQIPGKGAGISSEERMVIFASSLGTVFEWYDFYLYGSLAAIISANFFKAVNETTSFIFALLAFAAGFFVRPFGAIVFGRLGDLIGRKYTFLVTILLMGGATFIVGVLPTFDVLGEFLFFFLRSPFLDGAFFLFFMKISSQKTRLPTI